MTPTHPSAVDVPGSGPVMPAGGVGEAAVQPGCRIALREGLGQGIAEPLLRYVNDFGQGKGIALVEGGLTWLELDFQEDREMLATQFRDLLEFLEVAHAREF